MEIAIISGKGGTGKSSLSAAFATLNSEVVIADCDVDAANLYLLFNPTHEEEIDYISGHKAVINYDLCSNCGICQSYCRFDAISIINSSVVISEISCDGCFLCSRICPENAIKMVQNDKSRMYSGSFRNGKMVYGRLAPGEENSGKLVNMVREKAKQVSSENGLETIILDGPPGIGCPVISTITGVDKVVIVTEPTISGLHDMKRTVEIVQKFSLPAFVIINKYDLNSDMSYQIEDWCKQNRITIAGLLPFDKQMVEAMIMGKSITEFNPDLDISKKIKTIWNKILNQKK
ncbi:MAG: P-loop NTPase [Bacteroidales bacterium]|jgi:MinD superfamily P-loop ATPase|nr:P-loop NTPase [Bacteroidales bacterium]